MCVSGGALFRVQTLRIRCWFWLVLKAVGRESWPTGCARICVNSSPMGLFLNIYILELTFLTGTPQVEIINRICTLCLRPQNLSHHKGALLRWAEWCWLPFPQRGRVSEYGSHGALDFFSALLTTGVNEKVLRSDYKQIDILAFKLKYWKCLLARRHPPFRQS